MVVVLHDVQGIRDALIGDLLCALRGVMLWLKSRLLPSQAPFQRCFHRVLSWHWA